MKDGDSNNSSEAVDSVCVINLAVGLYRLKTFNCQPHILWSIDSQITSFSCYVNDNELVIVCGCWRYGLVKLLTKDGCGWISRANIESLTPVYGLNTEPC